MNAYPFSLFKRADRNCYSVKFKDEKGNYLPAISTGKTDKSEAMQAAFLMLRDGIPAKSKAKSKTETLQSLTLKETARKIKTTDEALVFLKELKRTGLLKSFVLKQSQGDEDFIAFLTRFWEFDESPYVREKLRKEHGIHRRYVLSQKQNVALYLAPFFKGRLLGEITTGDVSDFIGHMGDKKLSAARKNIVIKAGTIPLRWAWTKNMIDDDPSRGHLMFSEAPPKRNILTPAMAADLFNTPWKDEREMLGNLLASVTGMRCGEIQALRFRDLGPGCLHVRESWNMFDGRKTTKNNEVRDVELNFPEIMAALQGLANRNPWGVNHDSLVFWSDHNGETPFHGKRFINSMRAALVHTGLTNDEAKKYVFHSWRHFYTSYMVKDLDKKLLMSQTGHKDGDVFDRYADHETVGDREAIRAAQRRVFAGLLPQNVLAFKPTPGDLETASA